MSEIEKAIKHFENMRDDNFVVLDKFKKEIESGKVNGITTVYDNRHLYYSFAIEALQEKQERENGCGYCNTKRIQSAIGFKQFKYCPICGRKLGENIERD